MNNYMNKVLLFAILIVFLFVAFGCINQSDEMKKQTNQSNTSTVQEKNNSKNSTKITDDKNITTSATNSTKNSSGFGTDNNSKNITTKPGYNCINGNCSSNLDYIIITRPMFLESLNEFISFKKSQGYRVGVLTAEWINTSNQKTLLADKIKDKIQFFRKSGIKYFLLVGDASVSINYASSNTLPPTYHLEMDSLETNWSIPTGYYYRDLPGETYVQEEFTDVFFADPNNWDPDNNGVNGAINSASSNWQDFAYVGRWSVRNASEVKTITQKTLLAERNIASNKYDREILMLADNTLASPQTGSTDSCQEKFLFDDYSEDVFGFMSKSSCESNFSAVAADLKSEARFYTFDSSGNQKNQFERLFFSSNNLIVDEMFHGNQNLISAAGTRYTNNDTTRFQNVFPVLAETSCLVGTFYLGQTDSFNEALLKEKNGPAIIVQPENTYIFYKKLREGSTIGEAFYASKTIKQGIIDDWKKNPTSWLGSGNGLTLQAGDNLFGDPSAVIYPK
ncbi:hypothetical protein HZC07_05935 [Candidatus Micrarchaeota archaeon]|nr:hypothetical protein [Candidatus Micrarchaeota archaeon]